MSALRPLHDPELCSNPKCRCHTTQKHRVTTPFSPQSGLMLYNPYCCPRCSKGREMTDAEVMRELLFKINLLLERPGFQPLYARPVVR